MHFNTSDSIILFSFYSVFHKRQKEAAKVTTSHDKQNRKIQHNIENLIRYSEQQNPLERSHNPEVACSSPVPATMASVLIAFEML